MAVCSHAGAMAYHEYVALQSCTLCNSHTIRHTITACFCTCIYVFVHSQPLQLSCYTYVFFLGFTHVDGLSLLNEDGGLRVVFPKNSFVTNTTLTHTNTPRHPGTSDEGNDHIVCYGGNPGMRQVAWHNTSGPLTPCAGFANPLPCQGCGTRCRYNAAVGPDPQLNGSTNIHIYTNSTGYRNQDLECRVTGGPSAFIGVYLKEGGNLVCLYVSICTQ